MEPCTLLLLHSEQFLRQAMVALLTQDVRYRVLAHVGDLAAFKRAVAVGLQPRLVLLDLKAATESGQGLLHWCAQHLPHARLLLLGRHTEPEELLPAICAGAHGYFCTNLPDERLHLMLEHMRHDALYFPDAVLLQLREWRPPRNTAEDADLRQPSPTHCEFLRWVAHPENFTYAAIAERMGRSERAVEKYRNTLVKRYKVPGKRGLAQLAFRLGLVPRET